MLLLGLKLLENKLGKRTTTRIPIGRQKKLKGMKFPELLTRCRRNLTP